MIRLLYIYDIYPKIFILKWILRQLSYLFPLGSGAVCGKGMSERCLCKVSSRSLLSLHGVCGNGWAFLPSPWVGKKWLHFCCWLLCFTVVLRLQKWATAAVWESAATGALKCPVLVQSSMIVTLSPQGFRLQDSGPFALSRSLCPSSQPLDWDPCLWRRLGFWESSRNKDLRLLFTCFSQPLGLIQSQPLPASPSFSSSLSPSCPGCLKIDQLHLQLSNSGWLAELTAWPATLSFPASAILRSVLFRLRLPQRYQLSLNCLV